MNERSVSAVLVISGNYSRTSRKLAGSKFAESFRIVASGYEHDSWSHTIASQ